MELLDRADLSWEDRMELLDRAGLSWGDRPPCRPCRSVVG